MNTRKTAFRTIQPRERVLAALAALTASIGITGALVLGFEAASPDLWLTPTPMLLSRVAECEQQSTRQAQRDCKQHMVSVALARDKAQVRLAGR